MINSHNNELVTVKPSNALAVEVNNPEDWAHFLKPADRREVEALVTYLQRNKAKVYLGGSVVEGPFFGKTKFGRRDYSDIDFLASGDMKDMSKLAAQLHEMEDADETPLDYNNVKFEVRSDNKGFYFNLSGGKDFVIRSKTTKATPMEVFVKKMAGYVMRNIRIIDADKKVEYTADIEV